MNLLLVFMYNKPPAMPGVNALSGIEKKLP